MKPIASLLALAAGGGRRATGDIRFRWWQRFGSRRVEAPLRQLLTANPLSLQERAVDLRPTRVPSLKPARVANRWNIEHGGRGLARSEGFEPPTPRFEVLSPSPRWLLFVKDYRVRTSRRIKDCRA